MGQVIDLRRGAEEASFDVDLLADVLVIGGGPAGAWAGLAAARAGARVVVAEKGYLGTSGTQAASGTGAYYLTQDPVQREKLINSRLPIAHGFASMEWIEKVYDQSFVNQDLMSRWGYAFPKAEDGRLKFGGMRAADAVQFLRGQLETHGVTILDHAPALELLTSDGVVAGAVGVSVKNGKNWRVRAGAVVLATGGTAFRSGIAGGFNNTGDGYLLAGEVGAHLSGMEFSGQYGIAPKDTACTKTAVYNKSTMRDAHGEVVGRGKGSTIAEIETGELWCVLDQFDDESREAMIRSQPMTFQHFYRHLHIDPFKDTYQIEHLLEGTIRASGGIEVGEGSSTTVAGLYAAGDTTSREKLVGSNQSGAGPATAWALASGSWAGHSAAKFAKRFGNAISTRKLESTGGAGLRPTETRRADVRWQDLTKAVQEETLPVAKFYRRSGDYMQNALEKMNGLWTQARTSLAADTGLPAPEVARNTLRSREAAAMIAAARYIFTSGLERKESRGLHRRSDYPTVDPTQHSHVAVGGVDDIWIKRKPVLNSYLDTVAS